MNLELLNIGHLRVSRRERGYCQEGQCEYSACLNQFRLLLSIQLCCHTQKEWVAPLRYGEALDQSTRRKRELVEIHPRHRKRSKVFLRQATQSEKHSLPTSRNNYE